MKALTPLMVSSDQIPRHLPPWVEQGRMDNYATPDHSPAPVRAAPADEDVGRTLLPVRV